MAIKDPRADKIANLAMKIEHKTLVTWAIDCAERVLPIFERGYPRDDRPRAAIDAGRAWVETGMFKMALIRKAALDSHAAARSVEPDNAARSAARAAGQAVAAAHVPAHALAAAAYAAAAVRDSANPDDADSAVLKEREWQYKHLVELGNAKGPVTKGRR